MSNKLITADEINTVTPKWSHPVLPGHAAQGSILVTATDFTNPPQSSDNFVWGLIEDICGTHDVKLEYNQETNEYSFYKSSAHLNPNGTWSEDWYLYGKFQGITPEVQEALRLMAYVRYDFDTTTPNSLKVTGIKKDGTSQVLCNISFASIQYVDQAVTNLTALITAETTRATVAEDTLNSDLDEEISTARANENTITVNLTGEITRATGVETDLQTQINTNKPVSGNGINVTDSASGKDIAVNKGKALEFDTDGKLDVQVDNTTVKINNQNKLFVDPSTMEYTAGTGIDITNNVISATGVAFATGNGLQVIGEGTTAQLSVYPAASSAIGFNADKTMYINVDGTTVHINADNKLEALNNTLVDNQTITKDTTTNIISVKEKTNGGIDHDANGVYVKTNADGGIGVDANGLKVNVDDGLDISDNNIVIAANFNTQSSALGTSASGIDLYTDGKIGVAVDGTSITLDANGKLKGANTLTASDGVEIVSNNIQLEGEYETWTFTLDDSTTVTKKVRVFE